jgi:hypothetical protein
MVDGEIVAWLVGEVNLEIGRVWWLGPYVAVPEWEVMADALLAHAQTRLPAEISQQELAIDAAFGQLLPPARSLPVMSKRSECYTTGSFLPRTGPVASSSRAPILAMCVWRLRSMGPWSAT